MSLPIKNDELLNRALTHRSFLNESKDTQVSNERLEFLGDAVLELVVSKHLFHLYPKKPEGQLTALRASLVKTTTLAQVATKLGLGKILHMSRGEENSGGRDNTGLLANTFEAVIGAIFLDSGTKTVEKFLGLHLFPLLPKIIKNHLYRDFKSHFQETVQSKGLPTPTYKLLSQKGPDHQKIFTMAILVDGKTIAKGTGSNKQKSEQDAAQKALKKLEGGLKL